jgi:pimeloyl-ACP methyl ester carboxylesterase
MGEDNVEEFGAAVEGPAKLAPLLEAYSPHLLEADPGELAEGLKSLLSPPDVAVVNGGLAEELIAVTGEGIRATREGWLDDDLAFVKPWGFELGSISVPVQLWQGRQDLMVPPAHGEWLAGHVPGADVRLSDDDGHLSVEHLRIGDVHGWLLERF